MFQSYTAHFLGFVSLDFVIVCWYVAQNRLTNPLPLKNTDILETESEYPFYACK